MSKSNLTIGIDGIDASGKSILVVRVKELLGGSFRIVKCGGVGGDDVILRELEKRIRCDGKVSSDNRRLNMGLSIERQYDCVRQTLQEGHSVIQDRTFISYFVGYMMTDYDHVDNDMIKRVLDFVQSTEPLFVSDIHFLVTRPDESVLQTLEERRRAGTLSAYDRFLLDNPSIVGRQQGIMKRFGELIGAKIIKNEGTIDYMVEEFKRGVHETGFVGG